jgi:LPXTG-motif cell wall-anchored protein
MLNRYILVAAVLATSPLAAGAQFTAVITPPAKEPAAVVASSPAAAARADSSQHAKLTDMKLWVDSAAAALTTRDTTTRTDTAKTVVAPVATVTPPATHAHVSTGDSATLPDTATPLPAVALLGFTMLVAGLLMLRKRRA